MSKTKAILAEILSVLFLYVACVAFASVAFLQLPMIQAMLLDPVSAIEIIQNGDITALPDSIVFEEIKAWIELTGFIDLSEYHFEDQLIIVSAIVSAPTLGLVLMIERMPGRDDLAA